MKKNFVIIALVLLTIGCSKKDGNKAPPVLVDTDGYCSDQVVDLHLNLGYSLNTLDVALDNLQRRSVLGHCSSNNTCRTFDLRMESDRSIYKRSILQSVSSLSACGSVLSAPLFECFYDLEENQDYISYYVYSNELKDSCSTAHRLIELIQTN